MKINEIIAEAGSRRQQNRARYRNTAQQNRQQQQANQANNFAQQQSQQQTDTADQAQQPQTPPQPTANPYNTKAITQDPRYQGDPVSLSRYRDWQTAGQYATDIAGAIAKNTAKGVGSLAATATTSQYQRAPLGTKINAYQGMIDAHGGLWTKTGNGWVNANNILANPTQSEKLDRYWYVNTQKKIKSMAPPANLQPQQTADE